MRGLLQFIYQYRVYELFIILELVCAWLIVNNNRYHNVAFLNASNQVAGNVGEMDAIPNFATSFDLLEESRAYMRSLD